MTSELFLLIMWIIKDKNEHGQHYTWKAQYKPNFKL